MRASRIAVRQLSCLSALSAALMGLAMTAAPSPAAAMPMDHAWTACSGDHVAPKERLAQCTAIINSGQFRHGDLATALLNRGFARAALENYAGAIADYDEAEKLSPTLAWIPSNRGFAWLHSNDPESALADFNRAIALKSDEARIYWGRALAYARLDDNARAFADLNEAVRLAPRALEPRLARADLYIKAGQRDRAIADFEAMLDVDAGNKGLYDALKHHGIAVAEISSTAACKAPQATPQERVDACTALIESGNAEGNALAVAYGNRGRALKILKQYERAFDDLNEAIRIEPNYPIAVTTRGQLFWLKNDPQAAIADFTRAIELEPSVWGYLQRAEMLIVVGALDRAVADTTEAIKRDPKVALAWTLRAVAKAKLKDIDAAIADYTHAIDLKPKSTEYLAARANLYLDRKDYALASADLSAVIALEPSPATYTARGWAYRQASEKGKAIADYQKALELDPDFDIARTALGSLGGEPPASAALPPGDCISNDAPIEKRIQGCASVIASGTVTGWTLKTAHCNMAYWLTDAEQYDRVIEASDAAIKVDASWACAYLNRGRGWYYKHDLDRALADYNETLRLDPKFHEAYANRGTVHFDRKEFAAAIADYDRAIAIEAVPMYVSDRGNTRFNMGDYDRAIADQTRAIGLDPNYAAAYVRRGWALIRKEDYARAEADFAKALELVPGDPHATAGLEQAREYREHPAYAAQDREAAKGLSFDRFRQMVDKPQAPQQ